MNFDIRIPIGTMFSIIGLVLTVYGFATSGNEMYAVHSLGLNMNLYWGLAMLVFGVVMFAFGMKAQIGAKKE